MLYFCANGEMAEWSNAAVLKTVVRSRGPGVRIPLSPQTTIKPHPWCGFIVGMNGVESSLSKGIQSHKKRTRSVCMMVCRDPRNGITTSAARSNPSGMGSRPRFIRGVIPIIKTVQREYQIVQSSLEIARQWLTKVRNDLLKIDKK